MQCKNIDTDAILRFLGRHQGEWCNWFSASFPNSVQNAMPSNVPPKLALAKMVMLIRSGLVSGCGCGCRGDFEVTDKGLARIGEKRIRPMITPCRQAKEDKP